MIDPATVCFNIMSAIKTKIDDVITNTLEHMWLTKYPWPTKVILDRGTEFMAEVITLLHDDYDIKRVETRVSWYLLVIGDNNITNLCG